MLALETAGLSLGASAVASLATVPVASRVARRTGFLDRPVGYKKHGRPTPYLGGAAVLAAFVIAAVIFGDGHTGYLPLLAGAFVLWVVGTVDDRVSLSPWPRMGATIAVAVGLAASGHGWNVLPGSALDLMLTVVWVLGLVNAFNLMDNLDGAAATVAAAACLGIGAFAIMYDDVALAGLSLALAGACIGFLRFNLARPSRIFLGDGGSMPIGFIVAAMAIAAVDEIGQGPVLTAALLVGLVILDTALVVVSRRRRGVQLLTGGRDHLTHRLLIVVGTPRRVAAILAIAQLGLCALALIADSAGGTAIFWIAAVTIVAGLGAIAYLESRLDPAASDREPHAGNRTLAPARVE